MSLYGKVALVTGAGGRHGVGRATALELASAGADVIVTDVSAGDVSTSSAASDSWRGIDSVADEIRALGRRAVAVSCDLTQLDRIDELVAQAIAELGSIDILVNNARAVMGHDQVPVTELSIDVWRLFLDVNLTAVFHLTKVVGQSMIERAQGGRIINIGSSASKRAKAKEAAYAASKFAVLGLAQSAAIDLAPHGITVNTVCPGYINTRRPSYLEEAQAKEEGITLAELQTRLARERAAGVPVGRIAEPEDVAHLVAFLASDESAMITGQAYNLNGGTFFA